LTFLHCCIVAKPFNGVWDGILEEANLVGQEQVNTVTPFNAVLVMIVTFVLVLFLGSFFFLTLWEGLALILSELLILIVPLSFMLYKRVNIKSFVRIDIKPKFIMLGLASAIIILAIDIIVSLVLTTIFGVSQAVEESNATIASLSSSPSGLIAVATALILAGVCEEFAFRGFLQSAFDRKYSFIPAVIVSSVTFGIFHFDPQLVYTLSAIVAGLALGYIYHRWNSYAVSAIAHATVNLIVLATLLLAT
jgi:membrane protease YdiL (CAAX protease family)